MYCRSKLRPKRNEEKERSFFWREGEKLLSKRSFSPRDVSLREKFLSEMKKERKSMQLHTTISNIEGTH